MESESLKYKKQKHYTAYIAIVTFFLFGILVWHKLLFAVYLPGVEHPKKLVLAILAVLWTIGFFAAVGLTLKNIKLGLYSMLMLVVFSMFFNGWLKVWGFPLLQGTVFYSRSLIFYAFLLLFVFIGIAIYRCPIKLPNLFSARHIQEALILFLLFSIAFFITKNVFDARDPAGLHSDYFTDRNTFPPDHRILIPSFIEVAKDSFQLLRLGYFADIQRLYKLYLLVSLTASSYIYYYFLQKFFKRECSLLISIGVLFLFSLSFYVGGLVDDPFHLLAFIIGLILVYYKKDIYFWLLIFIASFNKETIWFLIFVYLVHNLQFVTRKNWWRILGKTSVFSLTFVGVSLFKIIIKPIHSTDFNWITYNFSCEQCILHVFLILSIFWILAFFFMEHSRQLRFFSRLNFITPFYVAFHFLGLVREVRLFIPIALILVPLGIGLLFPDAIIKEKKTSLAYLFT